MAKLNQILVNPSGEYFASCLYDDGQDLPQKSSEGKAVGIDVGLTHFAITSDGTKHGNPKYYRKYEQRLARRQVNHTICSYMVSPKAPKMK